jgi:hypothetical protein
VNVTPRRSNSATVGLSRSTEIGGLSQRGRYRMSRLLNRHLIRDAAGPSITSSGSEPLYGEAKPAAVGGLRHLGEASARPRSRGPRVTP